VDITVTDMTEGYDANAFESALQRSIG